VPLSKSILFYFCRCIAKVGRRSNGWQHFSLGDGLNDVTCPFTKGSAIRLALNILGFNMENTRSDRDFYIQILSVNSKRGKQQLFIDFIVFSIIKNKMFRSQFIKNLAEILIATFSFLLQ